MINAMIKGFIMGISGQTAQQITGNRDCRDTGQGQAKTDVVARSSLTQVRAAANPPTSSYWDLLLPDPTPWPLHPKPATPPPPYPDNIS